MENGAGDRFVKVIVELKAKRPFDPFRIVTTRGEKLLIAEPEMVIAAPGIPIRVLARSGRLVELKESDIAWLEELKVKIVA